MQIPDSIRPSQQKLFCLSIVILSGGRQALSTADVEALKERFLALDVQITFINFSFEGNKRIRLAKEINRYLSRLSETCTVLALTNVFPDMDDASLNDLVEAHRQLQHQFICCPGYEAGTPLSKRRYWFGIESSLWEEVGGFCPFLSLPDSFFPEIVRRSTHKGLKRSSKKINVESAVYFPVHAEEPVRLIKRDKDYFNAIYSYQNYLKLKQPDFIVIGVQKSSTSSIINTLMCHPDIFVPAVKQGNSREVHFFNSGRYDCLGIKWYSSLFHHPVKKISGEKTPDYIDSRQALKRIKKHCPDTKLIVSLRNPVDRAWSALQHIRSRDTRWGLQILKQGTAAEAFELLWREHLEDSIIQKGCYFSRIKYLFELFPREQVKIIIHERMYEDHEATYRSLFLFLGVDSGARIPEIHKNKGQYADTRSELSKQALQDYYRPYNEKLFELLGYDIPEWDSG